MRKTTYWVTTALVGAVLAAGGVMDLLGPPEVVETLAALGYPAYLGPMLGVWKVLGTLALLAPGFPRLKEWAYAGATFDFIGAAVSHAAVGDSIEKILVPIVFVGLNFASWWLRPESRKLPSAEQSAHAA